MNVIGYRRTSFRPQDGGQEISGVTLHLTEQRSGVEGLAVEHVFVSDRKLDGYFPQLGDDIRLFYNRYGKVDGVEMLPQ